MSDTYEVSPAEEQVAAETRANINLEGNAGELSVSSA
jgi:hypothetical protein